MSETPRTQQLIDIANDEGISDAAVALVLQEHSEQLERELADANIEIEGLEEEIVALCDRLKRVNSGDLEMQLAEARADAEHWKSECNALQRMVHEARAEIEQMRAQHLDRASATLWAIMRHAFMDGAFKGYQHGTEKRLRVQYFDEWCQKNYPEAVDKAIAQLRLIEQMREALEMAYDHICPDGDPLDARELEVCNKIEAALEAAERGE